MSVLKKVVKCDICGRYDCDADGRLKVKIREGTWDDWWLTKMDICPDCSHKMREWIKNQALGFKDQPSTVSRAEVAAELDAQLIAGNLTTGTAFAIIKNLFEEDSNEN